MSDRGLATCIHVVPNDTSHPGNGYMILLLSQNTTKSQTNEFTKYTGGGIR